MFERFTDRARKVMSLANQEAQRFNHESIETHHVLVGIVKEGSGVACNVLKNLGVDMRAIRVQAEQIVQPGKDIVTLGRLPLSVRMKTVIEYAMEEARSLKHNYVGTEHLLLGILREGENVAAQVLLNLGCNLANVREEVLNMLKPDEQPEIAAEIEAAIQERVRQFAEGTKGYLFLSGFLKIGPEKPGPEKSDEGTKVLDGHWNSDAGKWVLDKKPLVGLEVEVRDRILAIARKHMDRLLANGHTESACAIFDLMKEIRGES